MPKVSEQHQEARRRQLLAAAARCIARRGFAETSVREIYEEAGLSAGSVYVYFRSKDEIVEALAHDVLARLTDRQELLERFDDPLEGVIALVRALVSAASLAPEGALALRVQAWGTAVTHPPIAGFFREGFEGMRGTLAAALERGQGSGHVESSVEADAVARVVLGMLHGLVLQLVLGTGTGPEAYGEACIRMIERALRPGAAA